MLSFDFLWLLCGLLYMRIRFPGGWVSFEFDEEGSRRYFKSSGGLVGVFINVYDSSIMMAITVHSIVYLKVENVEMPIMLVIIGAF